MKKVMIVDDEELNRELFSDLFEDEDGIEVKCCIDGQEGIDAMDGFEPDVIIMDIMMPRVNGFEATKAIRESDAKRQPKIIVVTGMAGDNVEEKSKEVGADRVFLKPVNIRLLLDEVVDG